MINNYDMEQQIERIQEMLAEVLEISKHNAKNVLDADDVAMMLGVTRPYVYRLTSKKLIPHYKSEIGKVTFKRVEIEEWLTRYKVETKDESKGKAAKLLVVTV